MTPWDALQKAQERGLDLVEVAPGANPPVCRIMDYGKYKYEQKKKQAASKAKAHAATLKEVKLRPRTDDHDLDFKVRSARRFLIEGDKVKVTLRFRGRCLGVCRVFGDAGFAGLPETTGALVAAALSAAVRNVLLYRSLVESIEEVAQVRREAGQRGA